MEDMKISPTDMGSMQDRSGSVEQGYLEGLLRERESLFTSSGMDLTRRLVSQEIERIQGGGISRSIKDERRMADVTKEKAIKLTVRVLVPVRDHPKFNFVGKLLGPKGNSLKRLQEETMSKMAILGRGSMRDKAKEEELRLSGDPKFNHLSEDLHVEVTAVAPPAEAHARIAYALTEIRRYLVPDYNDEIRQEQMREMQIINSSGVPVSANGGTTTNNGTASGSDEGSASPHSTGSPPPQGATVKDGNSVSAKASSRTVGGRRSVLSLLTRARAIQQKEQELFDAYHEIPSYNVYDHIGDVSMSETQLEELPAAGRGSGGSLKVTTSPTDRARFRHDPYPRIPSST